MCSKSVAKSAVPTTGRARSSSRSQVACLLYALILFACTLRTEASDPAIRFVPARGLFTNDVRISLVPTTQALDARILFTTDGSLPSPTNGTVWNAPLTARHSLIIRAAIWRGTEQVTPVSTHSYLRIDHVPQQNGDGFPRTWGMREEKPVKAHYLMASAKDGLPEADEADLRVGLMALPVLSVVLPRESLFGEASGIYSHPMEHGGEWERAASVEWIDPASGKQGAASTGLRIQGGWNRRPEECPKHSLRLGFKKGSGFEDWGSELLGKPKSELPGTLILRGGCNNTWLHWSSEERSRGDYIRDQWMRETYSKMGHLSAKGLFVHVYLNGLYWGIYNLVERPDASFAAAMLGGKKSDYDSRNGENIISGDDRAWNQLFALVNKGVSSGAIWEQVQARLDVTAFADYMLLNIYGANGDWDRASNWYAVRPRKKDGKYLFVVWDGERTLEAITDNRMDADDDQCPTRLFQKLREWPDFRALFAARVQKHLVSREGTLTAEAASETFRKWAELLRKPIVAESARWGNYRRDVHPYKTAPYEFYTRQKHWNPEITRLTKDYFKRRPEALIEQLRSAGLFPPAQTSK